MDRIDMNVGFAARVATERTALTSTGDVGFHPGGKVCPGTNLKPDDDVVADGQVVRVIGGKLDDPTAFYACFMDWGLSNPFTVTSCQLFYGTTPLITDRAPADPEDTDPIYVEPEPQP